MQAREITDNVWILETSTNEKIGIINYNIESSEYSVISTDIDIKFSTFKELSSLLGEEVTEKKKESTQFKFKDINGYPIQHEQPTNIIELQDKIQYNNKNKIYYSGYWCTPSGNNTSLWYVRVSLSKDIYDSYVERGITPIGPFKDKMEALFGVKQGEYYCKNNGITLE